MGNKVEEAGGCKKFDCPDYPYLSRDGVVIITSDCVMCKKFKKSDIYKAQKKKQGKRR